jgi:rubrerythrin
MSPVMDRMASIEMALKNERTEMQFYLDHAKRSKNPLARAMFQTCARDEAEHMSRIQHLHERLIAAGSWPAEMPIEVSGSNIKDVLDAQIGKKDAEDHDMDDEKALEHAAAFESRGMEFYEKLALVCENPAERGFFTFLATIEREHYLSISETLFYLRDPEAWYEEKEKIHIDGA